MNLRGIVRSADLAEDPPGSDRVAMVLKVQGVGPGQPRTIVIPFDLLVGDESLDPESVVGHGFEADVEAADDGRWMVSRIDFGGQRVLRREE